MPNAPIDDNHHKAILAKDSVTSAAFPVKGRTSTGAMFVESIGGALITEAYDYIEVTEGATTDVFQYKVGGTSGTLISTVTITYTDATKAVLDNVART